MAVVTRVKCDNCRREVPYGTSAGWYEVIRNNTGPSFTEDGDQDRIDFCSLPCLHSWAALRALAPGDDPDDEPF